MAEDPTYDIQLEADSINTALLQVHAASASVVDSSDNMVRASAIRAELDAEAADRAAGDAALSADIVTSKEDIHFAQVRGTDNSNNLSSTDFSKGDITVDLGANRVYFNKTGIWRISGKGALSELNQETATIWRYYTINDIQGSGTKRCFLYLLESGEVQEDDRTIVAGSERMENLTSGDYFKVGDTRGDASSDWIYNFEYIGAV